MSEIHREPHPKARQIVRIKKTAVHFQQPDFGGSEFWLEDWWDRVAGMSWKFADGNRAACVYAFRCGALMLPIDDEVVYGKIDGLGHIVHVTELEGA